MARNKAVSILRSAKREFYNNSFEENKNNTRAIWKSIKTLTGAKNNTRQIKNLKIDGREVDDKTEMAEQFNIYFSTVAEKIRRHLSTVPFDLFKLVNFVKSRKNDQEVNFSVPVITISQVIKTIMKINPHKASGIDKISARLLRIAAPVIAPSITRIINMSLSTGKFPSRWKTAMVTPLYKKGTECDPSDYRPISVLPILSKVIERHFHDSLYICFPQRKQPYLHQTIWFSERS